MATGASAARLDAFLAEYAGSYVQLHSGDPGASGTANVSTATTVRKQVTLGSAETNSGNRRRRNSVIVRWDAGDVTGSQSATHASLWDAASSGTFLGSFALASPVSLTSGTPAEIPINGLEVNGGPVAA
jgi:chitodextrinase